MFRQIQPHPHLSVAELERRYRAAYDPNKRRINRP
jgi:hypothetical protein